MIFSTDNIDDLIDQVRLAEKHGHDFIECRLDPYEKVYADHPTVVHADLLMLRANLRRMKMESLQAKARAIMAGMERGRISLAHRHEAQQLLQEMNAVRDYAEAENADLRNELKHLQAAIDVSYSQTITTVEPEAGVSKTPVVGGTIEALQAGNLVTTPSDTAEALDRVMKYSRPGRTLFQVVEEAVSKYPHLMKLFYPRQYDSVGQYHSPRHVSIWLSTVVAECLRYGFFNSPTAYRLVMPALKPLADKFMPMFFISPELLKAVQQTDFADDIDWTTMNLPYEHGIFVLPKGGYSHPTDGEVSAIIWSRTVPGHYPPPCAGIPTCEIQHTAFATLAVCHEKGIWYDSCLNASQRSTFKLRNLFYRGPGEDFPKLKKSVDALDEDLTEADAPFLEGIGVITFGTLLAMNARPELLERAKLLKRVPAKGDKPAREFWSPNVIGAKYKAKREVPSVQAGKFVFTGKEGPSGTHASPRMHWRRGHFRNQPYGPGMRERRVIWIEPCLIAAVKEEHANVSR